MLSHSKSSVLGIQHVLAMYAGAVLVPLLIGGGLGFNSVQMTYLVSIDIFMCGIATLLQLAVNRFFGIGLPVVLGCAIQAVTPLILIGNTYSIGSMYGAIIVSGIFVVLIAGVFSKIKRFLPPVVTGTVITVIGLSLIPIGVMKIGGGDPAADIFGDPINLLLAGFTIVVIVAIQIYGRGFLGSIGILLGLIAGTALGAALGVVHFDAVREASWLHYPQPFYFGLPEFHAGAILTMMLISIVSLVESTGVYFALGNIMGQEMEEDDLKRGYRAEGLAVILGGIMNTFPYTTFSQNVGLVKLSGIREKRPIYYAAGFLILLGLVPKIGACATIIPEPVLGGAMFVLFGMVAIQGMQILSIVDFADNKNLFIVALSLGAGLGVTVYPDLFTRLPQGLQLLTTNGIVIAALLAIVLNALWNGTNPYKGTKTPQGMKRRK